LAELKLNKMENKEIYAGSFSIKILPVKFNDLLIQVHKFLKKTKLNDTLGLRFELSVEGSYDDDEGYYDSREIVVKFYRLETDDERDVRIATDERIAKQYALHKAENAKRQEKSEKEQYLKLKAKYEKT
jgi:hypothetical protein